MQHLIVAFVTIGACQPRHRQDHPFFRLQSETPEKKMRLRRRDELLFIESVRQQAYLLLRHPHISDQPIPREMAHCQHAIRRFQRAQHVSRSNSAHIFTPHIHAVRHRGETHPGKLLQPIAHLRKVHVRAHNQIRPVTQRVHG